MVWEITAPAVRPHGNQFPPNFPTGCCTIMALATCKAVAEGTETSVAGLQALMMTLYKLARQYGDCAPNGAATQRQMIDLAGHVGMHIRATLPYQEPLPESAWLPFLRRYAGAQNPEHKPYPVLIQVAQGRNLIDAETGERDEPTLNYHALALYGTQVDTSNPLAGGYIGNDSDNAGANQHPVIYSRDVLALAQPVSMIAFDYAPLPAPKPAPPPVKPPAPPPASDNDIDLPPNVAADIQKQLAAALASINDIAAALNAAKKA